MTVIGELIKKAISLSGWVSTDEHPAKAQKEVLKKLLEQAKHTAFGKHYHFEDVLNADALEQAFQAQVPIHDYDKIHADWWHYLAKGHQNITWPGTQQYFALSSGTTSHSKQIPVTDDLLEAIRKAGIQQVLSLRNFDLPASFFEKQILMLGSCTQLIKQGEFLMGEISGISAANLPVWFKGYYKPGQEIASIEDWDLRIEKIAEEAPNWDIGSLSGIPAWIELMLKAIIEKHQLQNIHQIWPNLMVYTTGGVAFEPYRNSLEKLLAHPLIYIDTYLASEGFIAMQKRPHTTAMALTCNNGIFFEFVPFEEQFLDENGAVKQDAPVYTLEHAEENKEYVLLISTVAGAWRYMIGDTVMITDKTKAEIKITGRTKHFLNVVGSQLSVHQMNKAIAMVEQEFDLEIKEFVVGAVKKDDAFIHQWILGCHKDDDEKAIAAFLDKCLQNLNKNYTVARSKALKAIEVRIVPVDYFYLWSDETKKMGGQVKIPRVMKENELLDLENYFSSLEQKQLNTN